MENNIMNTTIDMPTAEKLMDLFYYTPCNVFCKDLKYKYLMCNYTNASILGLKNPGDIVGKTDLELPWNTNAANLTSNDWFVISKKIPYYFEEYVILQNKKIKYFSHKIPLINKDRKVIGVMGICSPNQGQNQEHDQDKPIVKACLTIKEEQISKLIAQGKKTKEIANVLGVSAGTINWHRHNINEKIHLKSLTTLAITNAINKDTKS